MSKYCYMKDPCPICGGKMIDTMEYHKPVEPTCEPGDCQHVDESVSRLRASLAAVTKERDELKTRVSADNAIYRKEWWCWQGDGNDHPESLTCHVLMTADQLRAILSDEYRRAAELAFAKERERFKTLIQNTVNILNEDGKYAILCEKLSAAIRAGKEVGSE